jgi:hypothetical protein
VIEQLLTDFEISYVSLVMGTLVGGQLVIDMYEVSM